MDKSRAIGIMAGSEHCCRTMRIQISHETVYRYEQPARGVIQTLRLTPRNHDGQYVENWRIDVSENCQLDQHEDAFGNITHVFSVEGPLSELRVLVEGEVDTQDTSGVVRRRDRAVSAEPVSARDAADADRPGDRGFRQADRGSRRRRPAEIVHDLLERLHNEMVFDNSPTQATTTAAEAFALKRGVCQDLTHIFIAGGAKHAASRRAISAAISTATTA